MVTANFTIQLKRAVSEGRVQAVGKIVKVEGAKVYVESVMVNGKGDEVATGSGLFLPLKMKLSEIAAYSP